jgi:hypothetical protein
MKIKLSKILSSMVFSFVVRIYSPFCQVFTTKYAHYFDVDIKFSKDFKYIAVFSQTQTLRCRINALAGGSLNAQHNILHLQQIFCTSPVAISPGKT